MGVFVSVTAVMLRTQLELTERVFIRQFTVYIVFPSKNKAKVKKYLKKVLKSLFLSSKL